MTDSPFLTVAEVAALLRVSPQTVHRLIAAGDLKGVKIGGAYRVFRGPVDDLMRVP